MRYFTPERYVQLQRIDDERSFTTAYEEWERALATYREDLIRIEPRLPVELRQFATGECLHDATLLAMWREDLRLSMLLRPEHPARRLVLLVYELVEPPRIDHAAFSPEYGTPHVSWLYDEIGLEEEAAPGEQRSGTVFTHAVLFSDGSEVRLRLERFSYFRPEDVLGPEQGLQPASAVSRVALGNAEGRMMEEP